MDDFFNAHPHQLLLMGFTKIGHRRVSSPDIQIFNNRCRYFELMNKLNPRIIRFPVIAAFLAAPRTIDFAVVARAKAYRKPVFKDDTLRAIQAMGLVLIVLPTILKGLKNRSVQILVLKLCGYLLAAGF